MGMYPSLCLEDQTRGDIIMKPYTTWMVRMLLSCILISPSILLAADEAVIQDLQSDVTATKGKADQNAADINSMKGGLPELQRQINDLQTQINNMPPGSEGPQGEQGPAGADGADGVDGLSCWDLNGNHMCDVAVEDKDNSGICDALDCQGPAGQAGADAPDRSAEICVLYETLNTIYSAGLTTPEYCVTEPTGPLSGSYNITLPIDYTCYTADVWHFPVVQLVNIDRLSFSILDQFGNIQVSIIQPPDLEVQMAGLINDDGSFFATATYYVDADSEVIYQLSGIFNTQSEWSAVLRVNFTYSDNHDCTNQQFHIVGTYQPN